MRKSYRITEVSIPKADYAATDAEWRRLPADERIVHVFTISTQGTVHPSFGGNVPLLVLVEKDEK